MADVSNTLAAWSPTTNSNNPSGATNIATGLDDNIRELQGVVVRGLSHKGSDLASSSTPALGATEGLLHDVTGTATIVGWDTIRAGLFKITKFEGVLTLTHNATSLILPGGANITTADGDVAGWMSEGSGNWRCLWYVKATGLPPRATLPTQQIFTSGSGTYTTPTNCRMIRIRMVGGGAGGAGASANNGNDGGDTTFDTLTAGKGAGGVTNSGLGGAGGTATNGDINIPGGSGGSGINHGVAAGANTQGGAGGVSFLGGAAGTGQANAAGRNAATNSGSGGSGGGNTGAGSSGGGGGAGAYCEKFITSPSATYSYAVGAGGNGGSAGTNAGGDGAAGIIIVDEFYL